MIRDMIVDEARRWLGTPFMHQASVCGAGSDCIGLVRGAARGVGFRDPFATGEAAKFAGYGREPEPGALLEAVASYLVPVAIEQALHGDILLMRFLREPQHFALISARFPDYIIHSHAAVGKVVENSLGEVWRKRTLGAYRFKELA